jgi:hypothetical protein
MTPDPLLHKGVHLAEAPEYKGSMKQALPRWQCVGRGFESRQLHSDTPSTGFCALLYEILRGSDPQLTTCDAQLRVPKPSRLAIERRYHTDDGVVELVRADLEHVAEPLRGGR